MRTGLWAGEPRDIGAPADTLGKLQENTETHQAGLLLPLASHSEQRLPKVLWCGHLCYAVLWEERGAGPQKFKTDLRDSQSA